MAEVRAGSHRGTGLSGVAPDCPVPQEDKAPMVNRAPNPNGWVTWRPTGQGTVPVRCAHRQQTPHRLWKWMRAINTPNHLIHNHPSIPNISFNTRAKDSYPRHIKQIESSLSLRNQLNSIRDLREGFLVFFVSLVAWLGLFLFNSYSQVLCKRSKRH
jgi:hypothetical protein